MSLTFVLTFNFTAPTHRMWHSNVVSAHSQQPAKRSHRRSLLLQFSIPCLYGRLSMGLTNLSGVAGFSAHCLVARPLGPNDKWMEGEGWRKRRWGGEEGTGMKCSAIKLSEPLTFLYKGAYLPRNGCLCSAPLAHKCRLMDENSTVYI